jgi:hypothetical protein
MSKVYQKDTARKDEQKPVKQVIRNSGNEGKPSLLRDILGDML